jgi:hypothetical protein
MKPPVITLSGVGMGGSWERDGGGDLTNVQCKAIQNYHKISPRTMKKC